MVKRRHTLNPAKVKLDASALNEAPPPEVFNRRLELRRRLSVAMLGILTVVLLSVSFAPFDCWALAYVAMVPWILGLAGGTRGRWTILWGWLAGLLFWAANLYWLWWVDLTGYSAAVLYLSVYWLAAAILIRAAIVRNMPLWVVFPVVWVALEYAREYVISGFPWFFLAHSQYMNARLIQVADLTGQYGVSFFVALVNGAVADMLVSPLFVRSRRGPRTTRKIVSALAAVAVSVAVLLGYGTWRLSQETFQEGPVIGIVQCSFRNTLTGREKTEQEVLEGHVSLLKELEGKGCDLVVLPETMLPQGLNAEMLNLDLNALGATHLRLLAEKFIGPEAWEIQSEEHLRSLLANAIQGGLLGLDLSTFSGPQLRTLAGNFAGREIAGTVPDEILRDRLKTISSLAGLKTANGTPIPGQADYAIQVGRASERLRCPVLAGGVTWHFNDKPTYHGDEWLMRNSAMWFDQSWLCSRLYSKMHLVPFSEYVPFKHSSPWLYRQLRLFVPSVMSQVEPGDKLVRFDLRREAGAWQVATPICYEGTFARVCRAMVRSGPKDRLIVANLSNDGWFVWRSPSGVNNPSSEHAQHLASYCFRAVENRVPVVRAVNTGISASIDSNGRIAAVLERYGKREMATGTLLLDGVGRNESKHLSGHGPKVLVDSRISMYSFVGDVFAMLVCAVALWLTAYIVLDGLRSNRAQS